MSAIVFVQCNKIPWVVCGSHRKPIRFLIGSLGARWVLCHLMDFDYQGSADVVLGHVQNDGLYTHETPDIVYHKQINDPFFSFLRYIGEDAAWTRFCVRSNITVPRYLTDAACEDAPVIASGIQWSIDKVGTLVDGIKLARSFVDPDYKPFRTRSFCIARRTGLLMRRV